MQVWDLENPKHESLAWRDSAERLAISNDGRWGATAGDKNLIRLWDLETVRLPIDPLTRFGKPRNEITGDVMILSGFEGRVAAMTISSDSRWLIVGSSEGTIRVWDLRSSDPSSSTVVFRGHAAAVSVQPEQRFQLVVLGRRNWPGLALGIEHGRSR